MANTLQLESMQQGSAVQPSCQAAPAHELYVDAGFRLRPAAGGSPERSAPERAPAGRDAGAQNPTGESVSTATPDGASGVAPVSFSAAPQASIPVPASPPSAAGADRIDTGTGLGYDRPFLISDLCNMLHEYLDQARVAEVYEAYLFGAEAHEGQHRKTGEPYIYHPLAVARILARMKLDHESIVAALLHDVLEDTEVDKQRLSELFGSGVAELVDGVTKLTQIEFGTRAEAQAASFRKMVLAMARDIRVILIKLADRLHNMRTLHGMPADKRRRIARETLDIYAPIANRLGINFIRLELEDLGFAALYPLRYRVLEAAVKRARGDRKEVIERIQKAIGRRMRQEGLEGRVRGREKHLYSIYLKMRHKQLSFKEVLDIYAFRIVVERVDSCYRMLGAMHNLYKPVPGKFKDYIAIPKSNGYQSLHTGLVGPFGVHIEVQIRTEEMDKVAEAGIAAHWQYKVGDGADNSAQQRAREWLRGLLEMQQRAGDSLEFIENVKIDLFPDEVYVFSPQGKIFVLPRGATPVDFAYAVHTDVGHCCVAAKIDRRLRPLRTRLLNGQQVEIVTSAMARPNPSWLNFVATARARTNIRSYLKNLHRDEAVTLGRRLLGKALAEQGLTLEGLSDALVSEVLGEMQLESMDQLLDQIGSGNRIVALAARRFAQGPAGAEAPPERRLPPRAGHSPLAIQGTEGMVVGFAKCCRPIPGDQIIGYLSAGRGIVIHREDCTNAAEFRHRAQKWIEVEWSPEVQRDFPVDIRIDVANRRGVLAGIAAAISDEDSNIDNVTIDERDGLTSTLFFTLEVRNRSHLACIIRRLRGISSVSRIQRGRASRGQAPVSGAARLRDRAELEGEAQS